MKYLRISRGHAACRLTADGSVLPCGTVHAADAEQTNPLQFYTGEQQQLLKATLQVDMALFDQSNSWFGNAREALGEDSDSWWESIIRPGLEGSYFLPNTQEIYGRVDVVQANTGGGLDAAASNANSVMSTTPAHRKRLCRLAFRATCSARSARTSSTSPSAASSTRWATVSLLYSYAGSGGDRGAYWIGNRRSAGEYAGIVRMKTGRLGVDLVWRTIHISSPMTPPNWAGPRSSTPSTTMPASAAASIPWIRTSTAGTA